MTRSRLQVSAREFTPRKGYRQADMYENEQSLWFGMVQVVFSRVPYVPPVIVRYEEGEVREEVERESREINVQDKDRVYFIKQLEEIGKRCKGMGRIEISIKELVRRKPVSKPESWRREKQELLPSKDGFKITDKQGLTKCMGEVNSVLNKLTPENLESLTSRLVSLVQNSQQHLNRITQTILLKGSREEHFSLVYAEACFSVFTKMSVNNRELSRLFLQTLVRQCRQRFTEDSVDTGLLTFMGNLFNVGIISGTIVLSCFDSLLNQTNFEQAFLLLSVTGKILEAKLGPSKMAMIFEEIDQIDLSNHGKRVHFQRMDLQDLYHNQWTIRKVLHAPPSKLHDSA